MTTPSSIPERIGRYKIRAVLGRGGMGTVFHAYDPRFERDVAIKVLPIHLVGHEGLRTRFEREAKTIAALEHPAIVPVYDFDEHEGQPFLVMRLMPGGTLADRLAKGPLSTDEVARILQRIGNALDEAHDQGIVHRDLKPGNILFDKYDNAYLSDFGIVRLVEGTGVDLTGTGMIGTPGYMSPEQIQGQKVDGRTDIYALGVLVFEMLTARKPYTADTPAMLMVKQITEPIPDIHDLRPDLPPEMDLVFERSLSREREDRPATAGELAQMVNAAAHASTQVAADLSTAANLVDVASDPARTPPLPPTELEPETPTPPLAEIPPVAPTEVASPPQETPVLEPTTTTAQPVGKKGQSRWAPWLIMAMGVLFILGAIATAIFVISQLRDGRQMTDNQGISEPAGDLSTQTGADENPSPRDEPGDEIPDVIEVPSKAIEDAFALLENGDYEAAIQSADAILASDPQSIPAWEVRLYATRDLGRFDEALAAVDQLIELEPDNPGLYGERAITLDWSGDTESAIADVEKCLDLDPENTDCWFLLGTFHQLLGNLEAAKEAWLQAVDLGSDSADLYRELALITLDVGEDPRLALGFASNAVELAPEDAFNWHVRGVTAAAMGNTDIAAESFQRFLEIASPGECDECIAEAEAFLSEHMAARPELIDPDLGPTMFAVFINFNEPVLDDVRVRQALAFATDRHALAERARELDFMGAEPSPAWLHPALLNLDHGESGLPFDPENARGLLAEAGYADGDGFPELVLAVNDDPQIVMLLEMLRDIWREILGIEVIIEVIPEDYFQRLRQEPPPLYRLGYFINGPADTPFSILEDFFGTDADANFTGYSNPEFDRLLEEASRQNNLLTRRELFIQADNLVTAEDTVVIPLFYYFEER